jgi:hypothetical protein
LNHAEKREIYCTTGDCKNNLFFQFLIKFVKHFSYNFFIKGKTQIMRQLTLNIKESKFQAFLEFIKTLDYVEIPEAEKKALGELQKSLGEVKEMKDGQLEKQTVEDFLDT